MLEIKLLVRHSGSYGDLPKKAQALPNQAFGWPTEAQVVGAKCHDENPPMLHSGAHRFGPREWQNCSFSGRDASAGSGLVSPVVAPWNRADVDDARTTIRAIPGKESSVARASRAASHDRFRTPKRAQNSHFLNWLQTSKKFSLPAAQVAGLGMLAGAICHYPNANRGGAKVAPAGFCP
jgi:hypothetical protein